MKKLYFFLSLIGMFTLSVGLAQQKSVSGTIFDETGGPLPGATVIIEGTSQGVASDFDGNFSIQASQGETLVVSYVGYGDQRISVGNQDNYIISLVLAGELEEIIVIGYGSQSKRNLTDNIASLNSNDINDIPTPSVFNTVSGKVAGVQVSQINGKVEGGLSFRNRGQSSISAGAEANFQEGSSTGNSPLSDINLIRDRSSASPLTSLTIEQILNERQLELSFEGHLLHDIKRTERSVGTLAFNVNALVLPIPQSELDTNASIVQNQGY